MCVRFSCHDGAILTVLHLLIAYKHGPLLLCLGILDSGFQSKKLIAQTTLEIDENLIQNKDSK